MAVSFEATLIIVHWDWFMQNAVAAAAAVLLFSHMSISSMLSEPNWVLMLVLHFIINFLYIWEKVGVFFSQISGLFYSLGCAVFYISVGTDTKTCMFF